MEGGLYVPGTELFVGGRENVGVGIAVCCGTAKISNHHKSVVVEFEKPRLAGYADEGRCSVQELVKARSGRTRGVQ